MGRSGNDQDCAVGGNLCTDKRMQSFNVHIIVLQQSSKEAVPALIIVISDFMFAMASEKVGGHRFVLSHIENGGGKKLLAAKSGALDFFALDFEFGHFRRKNSPHLRTGIKYHPAGI